MLVFWDQRLVFLATPKTGSTAIEAALESLAVLTIQRPPALKHTGASKYQKFLRPFLRQSAGADFTVVAMMREPCDWLGSWYRYRQRPELTDPARSTREMSFDDFARAYCDNPPPAFANVGSQAQFLRTGKTLGVDRLFRYEAIDQFVAFLEQRLDCAITLPHLNVSPPGTLDLSAETRARLDKKQAADRALYAAI